MAAFTAFHVLLSLVGIATGLVVAFGLLTANRMDRLSAWFLGTTVTTSITGFLFPFHGFTPAIGLGIISMITSPLPSMLAIRGASKADGVRRM
jgi:hypothetical protein